MCAERCSNVQKLSSRTDAPMMMAASSFSDQMRHASSGRTSRKAVRKASTCGATAVTRVASATRFTYSSTLSVVRATLAPPGRSSISGWPGSVKSTQSPARASASMEPRRAREAASSGSSSRREWGWKGALPSAARQRKGWSCTSTSRLSRMHLATVWPSSRKRSRICCAAWSSPLASQAGSRGSGKSAAPGAPERKSWGSEVLRMSATCA
mmetsp:Transcript_35659/g.105918  ORF Transcript_35659/g.105918 Transcript_35659/m.105918 type:complete len:211 (+) Transcript_35659:400-1032(+)